MYIYTCMYIYISIYVHVHIYRRRCLPGDRDMLIGKEENEVEVDGIETPKRECVAIVFVHGLHTARCST